jgi:hypothetical protein
MLSQTTYIAYRSQILGDFWIVKEVYGFLHFAIYKKSLDKIIEEALMYVFKEN